MLKFMIVATSIAVMFLVVAMGIDEVLTEDTQGIEKGENLPLWKKILPVEAWVIVTAVFVAIAMIMHTEKSVEWVILIGYPLGIFASNFVADMFYCPRQGDKITAVVGCVTLLAMTVSKLGFVHISFDETSLIIAVTALFVLPRMAARTRSL